MKNCVFALGLVALLAVGLISPALAASTGPDVTWLSGAGKPEVYNRDLNWLTCKIDDDNYYVIDLESQAVIEDLNMYVRLFMVWLG